MVHGVVVMNGREPEQHLIQAGRETPPAARINRVCTSPVLRDMGRWVLAEATRRARAAAHTPVVHGHSTDTPVPHFEKTRSEDTPATEADA